MVSLNVNLSVSLLPPTDSASTQPSAESEDAHGARPPSPSLVPGGHVPSGDPSTAQDQLKHSTDPLRPKDPSLSSALPDKARASEGPSAKKSSSLLNSMRPPPPHPKDAPPASLNGRVKPWESFTAEEFAQQFHESVLQSTQKALQKHKGETLSHCSLWQELSQLPVTFYCST